MQRRDFLRGAAIGAGVATTAGSAVPTLRAWGAEGASQANHVSSPFAADPGERDALRRLSGRSGQAMSALGLDSLDLGASSLTDGEAIRLVHEAIDAGITFLDTGSARHGGRSQLRVGLALGQGNHRDRVFLAAKINGRTRKEAASQIETSLNRLRTDHVDLIQHQDILRFEDADRVFAEGGAMEAVDAARRAGTVGAVGFTGHRDPRIHLHMLDVAAEHGIRFDAVQMPLNVLDAHFRSFARSVLPRLVRERVAVLGTHPFGDGPLPDRGTPISAREALHYALTLPTAAVLVGMRDRHELHRVCQAVRTFKPMGRESIAELLSRSRPHALHGQHERFKTTTVLDDPARTPPWPGGDGAATGA